MLATVVLALFGTMACGVVLLSAIPGRNAEIPRPEQYDFPRPAEKDAVSPRETIVRSGFSPSSEATARCTTASTPEWAERMFTSGRTKDFGTVPFGTQLSHRFEITNIYATPVEITGLRLGCCCVTATPGKRLLQPGESTTIDVALDTREFTGPNTQTVRVVVAGPSPRTACVLKVSAVSQADVVFKPDRISFDTATRGRVSVQSIDVEYNGSFAWKVENVIIAKKLPFEATLRELVRQPGKVRYRLDVALKDDARPGKIRDYMYLRTNQIDVPPVPVLVTATVQVPPGNGSF